MPNDNIVALVSNQEIDKQEMLETNAEISKTIKETKVEGMLTILIGKDSHNVYMGGDFDPFKMIGLLEMLKSKLLQEVEDDEETVEN